MKHSRAAVRYAKAALDFAVEQKAVDAVEKDMRAILKAIGENDALREMLGSPVVDSETRKQALDKIFGGQHEISRGLIHLLIQNKRISMLNEVALKFVVLTEELKGRDVAYITTAIPLTEEMEKKALTQLAGITDKQVTLQNRINKDIIGGFILRVGDIQYDASIATRLNSIKREFTKSL